MLLPTSNIVNDRCYSPIGLLLLPIVILVNWPDVKPLYCGLDVTDHVL